MCSLSLSSLLIILFINNSLQVKKPNIIFILTDDQGYADVGFTNPETPFITTNVDNLAKEAVRLSNYYVHPTCTPTRASLMTGRYGVNVGLGLAFTPGNPGGLSPEYGTLAEELDTLGYKNHLIGKWHLGNSKKHYHPLNRGFHHFFGVLGGGLNSWTKQAGNGRYDLWNGWEPYFDNQTHITDLLNQEALNVIEAHAADDNKEPFFLFLAHTAPHDPLLPAPRHLQKCGHILNRARRLSCGMVAGIDEGVGQIVEMLKSKGMLDNTIIAYSHDNGGVPYAGALNYPLKGGKATVYEGGVKSPGFIFAPKLFKTPRDHEGLFHVSDFFPTFITMIKTISGQKGNKTLSDNLLDGIDQVPSLLNGKTTRTSVHIHRDLVLDSHTYRKGDWKLIVGNHDIPFIFPRVYTEPNSGFIIDNGETFTGKLLELFFHFTDFVVGEENYLFIKYFFWFMYNSHEIGGRQNFRAMRINWEGLYVGHYKSDLEKFKKIHSEKNPKVSLYNLKNDPQELVNVAAKYPDKVLELLAEAEEVVKDAPPEVIGNKNDIDAPKGPDAGTWWDVLLSGGTTHKNVIPFGPYLEDDVDLTKRKYINGFMGRDRLGTIIILIRVSIVFLILLLLPFFVAKYLVRSIL